MNATFHNIAGISFAERHCDGPVHKRLGRKLVGLIARVYLYRGQRRFGLAIACASAAEIVRGRIMSLVSERLAA